MNHKAKIFNALLPFVPAHLAAGMVLGLLAGCASTPPRAVHSQIMAWDDLTTRSVEPIADGFRRLGAEDTQGVFPAGVAVCRVIRKESIGSGSTGTGDGPGLALAMKPSHDVLPWNGAFDPIRGVAEAFPLADMDLEGHTPTIDRILHAAANLDSEILLLYSMPARTSDSRAEVKGVFYDLHRGEMLALVHSQVDVASGPEVDRPVERIRGDESYMDPEYLAARKFEQHAMACLLELRAHDHPAATSTPEGWQRPKDRPTVEWIQIP